MRANIPNVIRTFAQDLDSLVAGRLLWNNPGQMASSVRWAAIVVAASLLVPAIGWAQPTDVTTPSDSRADAYRLFLIGRYLEGQGDIDGAKRVLRAAAELDGSTGEILGELAALHVRQGQDQDAIRVANEALARDPNNLTAHRILGLVLAAQWDDRRGNERDVERAIEHLDQARKTILPDYRVELTLARLYLRQGRGDQTIALLEELLEDEAGFTEGGLLLSEAYEEAGRIGDAVTVVQGLVSSARPSSRALRRLGQLYGRQHRWGDAIQAYEEAVSLNPRDSTTRRELADALLEAGAIEGARDQLRQLTTMRPNDGSALYRLSEVELELGDLDASEAMARSLLKVEPNGVRGPYALAQVQVRRHEYRAVIETLEPAIDRARQGNLHPNQIASLLGQVGFAHERLQNFEAAIGAYAEATELLPGSLVFGARLVQSYLDAGQVDDARATLERVQARHSSTLTLVRLEARMLGDQGDVDEGVRVLQRVLSRNTDEPTAHIALASHYTEYGRLGDAVDVLEAATATFPDNVPILFQLGAVFERSDRYLDAEQAFRHVLARDSEHAAALNYLGYMLADRGERLEESVDLLERAIEIDPHNAAYLDSLGWAYFKLDRLDLAETHLRLASEQMVWNSVIQDHFGDLLYRLGRYAEAIEAWETALVGDGEDVESAAIEQKMEDARGRLRR